MKTGNKIVQSNLSSCAEKRLKEKDISRQPALDKWDDYRSKKLNFISEQKVVLTNDLKSVASNLFFLVFGIIAICWGVSVLQTNPRGWIGILAGTAFIIFTLVYFVYLTNNGRGCFDSESGWFWIGSPSFSNIEKIRNLPDCCQLSNVAYIQILEVPRQGYDDCYYIWELNLVRHNATRVHVMTNNSKSNIDDDAKKLATFLSVTVLDHERV